MTYDDESVHRVLVAAKQRAEDVESMELQQQSELVERAHVCGSEHRDMKEALQAAKGVWHH